MRICVPGILYVLVLGLGLYFSVILCKHLLCVCLSLIEQLFSKFSSFWQRAKYLEGFAFQYWGKKKEENMEKQKIERKKPW